jgi:hypothetical protein
MGMAGEPVMLYIFFLFVCVLSGYKPMSDKTLEEVRRLVQEEQGVVTVYV